VETRTVDQWLEKHAAMSKRLMEIAEEYITLKQHIAPEILERWDGLARERLQMMAEFEGAPDEMWDILLADEPDETA
jgi:hypothetical protein